MQSYKFALVLAALFFAGIATSYKLSAYNYPSTYATSHNFTLGTRLPGDRLVYEENIEKKSSLWQIVTVQKTFNATRFTKITKIEAIDLKRDGTGAYVTLIRGGPSYNNVTLRFKSQRNHGIHFKVRLYAR